MLRHLYFFAGANWRVAPCPSRAMEFRAPHARTRTHAQSMHLDESGYAYALNVSGVERWIKREKREGKEGKKADVATCLRRLICNHGALPPLGCVAQHPTGVAYLPIFYPSSSRPRIRRDCQYTLWCINIRYSIWQFTIFFFCSQFYVKTKQSFNQILYGQLVNSYFDLTICINNETVNICKIWLTLLLGWKLF